MRVRRGWFNKLSSSTKFLLKLHPGDLIYTAMPSDVDPICGGDVIRAEIELIGAMEVKVRNYS